MCIGWCGNIYGIHLRVVNELLCIGVPFRYAMPGCIIFYFSFVAAHDGYQLRIGYFVKCRAAFYFSNITAANHTPVYLLHEYRFKYSRELIATSCKKKE